MRGYKLLLRPRFQNLDASRVLEINLMLLKLMTIAKDVNSLTCFESL